MKCYLNFCKIKYIDSFLCSADYLFAPSSGDKGTRVNSLGGGPRWVEVNGTSILFRTAVAGHRLSTQGLQLLEAEPVTRGGSKGLVPAWGGGQASLPRVWAGVSNHPNQKQCEAALTLWCKTQVQVNSKTIQDFPRPKRIRGRGVGGPLFGGLISQKSPSGEQERSHYRLAAEQAFGGPWGLSRACAPALQGILGRASRVPPELKS